MWDSYYHESVPHSVVLSGSFWWRAVFNLADSLRSISHFVIGNGFSALFWEDVWQQAPLAAKFPRLFSFAKDTNASFKDIVSLDQLSDAFHLPLSVEAFQEYNNLHDMLAIIDLQFTDDRWVCNLNKGVYTPSSFYKMHFSQLANHAPSQWIWKSKCMSKHRTERIHNSMQTLHITHR